MDVFQVRSDADFSLSWIDALFRSGTLRVTVEAQSANEWALRHLFFEARNRERLSGSKSLVFGFPLFAVRDEQDHPMTLPLFFWNINMEASPNTSESWVLGHDAESGFSLNPVLAAWLERQCGPALSARYTGISAQRKPSGSEMVLLALELARETGLHVPVDNLTIMPCPADADLEAASGTPAKRCCLPKQNSPRRAIPSAYYPSIPGRLRSCTKWGAPESRWPPVFRARAKPTLLPTSSSTRFPTGANA